MILMFPNKKKCFYFEANFEILFILSHLRQNCSFERYFLQK